MNWKIEEGISLRDWFAGMALQGFVERSITITQFGFKEQQINLSEEIAKTSYLMADTMLKEREKDTAKNG